MTQRWWSPVVGLVVAAVLGPAWYALGCPFCASISQTLTEEFAAVDVVVIAQLEQLPPANTGPAAAGTQAIPHATFSIVRTLKGAAALGSQKTLTTLLVGSGQIGDKYLVTGICPPEFTWSTPAKVTDRQQQYLLDLMELPEEKAERLAFFQPFLEDADPVLSEDAYDEFARASYATVKAIKPKLHHAQLLAWIQDPQVPASRKRLYFTLLGVCGDQQDLPMLEQRLRDTDPRAKAGLDALIACYLTLRGPDGVALVEELFLARRSKDPAEPFADIYAAVMALRFHGTEGDVIPRERVLKAFALVLDNPQMADLIIPDLARWEDWSQLDRLVAMFKAADAKANNIRLPIVNYARVCPLPAAKVALEEFNRIDPAVVKRSLTFFPATPKAAK